MSEQQPVVFVVDDDRAIREATRSLLASVGLQVQTFGTAQEFLRAKRPDAPACLVLDVRLPGLSGLDLQRELASAGSPIPIVFVTGYPDELVRAKALGSGALCFLTKPFKEGDLLDGLKSALTAESDD